MMQQAWAAPPGAGANICEKVPGTDESGEARMAESGGAVLGEGAGGAPADIEFGAF